MSWLRTSFSLNPPRRSNRVRCQQPPKTVSAGRGAWSREAVRNAEFPTPKRLLSTATMGPEKGPLD